MELAAIQTDIGINQEALEEWVEYRKAKKKPLSSLALKKTLTLLSRHGHSSQQCMVDTAIMNDWQGLHPVEEKQNSITSTRNQSLTDDLNDTSWAH